MSNKPDTWKLVLYGSIILIMLVVIIYLATRKTKDSSDSSIDQQDLDDIRSSLFTLQTQLDTTNNNLSKNTAQQAIINNKISNNTSDIKSLKRDTGNDYVTIDDIKNKFNNDKMNDDGSPNGGILLTMFESKSICPNYVWQSDRVIDDSKRTGKCITNPSTDCGQIVDIANLPDLLDRIKGTKCTNMACTYWRKDLPKYVFNGLGAGEGGRDITVGLILDTQKLFRYIACMYTTDAITEGRFNYCTDNNDNEIAVGQILDSELPNNKEDWNNYLTTKESTKLGQTGCGQMLKLNQWSSEKVGDETKPVIPLDSQVG